MPEETKRRITEAEEQISELEDRMTETTAEEQNKETRMKRILDQGKKKAITSSLYSTV